MILYFVSNRSALGRKDSNLRIAGPKPVALPLGHAPPLFKFLFNCPKGNSTIGHLLNALTLNVIVLWVICQPPRK